MKATSATLALATALSSFEGNSQVRHYYSTLDSRLIDVDIQNCSIVSDIPCEHVYNGLAFTSNGELYGGNAQSIYRLDPTDCSPTLVGNLNMPSNHFILAMTTRDDGSLFFMCGNSRYLFSFDVGSGGVDTIGWVGHQPTGDLTWHQGKLYLTAFITPGTGLVRISLNPALTQVTQSNVVVNYTLGTASPAISTGAGPGCNEFCMLAMGGDSLYRFSHTTQAFQTLCTGLLQPGNYSVDAASSAEIGIFDEHGNGITDHEAIRNRWSNRAVVLTPNGDGQDDVLHICSQGAGFLRMRVYDSFGQMVHSEQSACPSWDGRQSGGALCAAGCRFSVLDAGVRFRCRMRFKAGS